MLERIVRWGLFGAYKVTAPGADYVTMDPKNGTIYIWDSKYRGPNSSSYPTTISAQKFNSWKNDLQNIINAMPDGPAKTMAQNSLNNGNIQGEIFKWPQ